MLYHYKCTECETIIDHEAPMGDELPKKKKCPKCGTKTCTYDFSQVLNSTIKVPEHMQSGNENVKYNKMSRDKKTFF